MGRADILASNLQGCADAGVAIAASRWGATGTLNLEGVAPEVARAEIARLIEFGRGRRGVKLDADSALVADLPEAIDTVVLTTVSERAWDEAAGRLRAAGRRILVECVSAAQQLHAVAMGADAIVAKGSEAAGFVGEETTFVLVQRFTTDPTLPVYAYGGIGLHSAAACYAAGCVGVMVDAPFALTREAVVPEVLRAALLRAEGDDTVCVGVEHGALYRAHRRPGLGVIDELQMLDQTVASKTDEDVRGEWRRAVADRQRWSADGLWPFGQDASLAARLAGRHRSVPEILDALVAAVTEQVAAAQRLRPFDRRAPLAESHGTEYPILQGPMTRVSDTAAFAEAVARGGGLPFLALALMRGAAVRPLLEQTREVLGARPWGAGILGFVPPDLRNEQLEIIREVRPNFVLIAGGRPDQAVQLEEAGIPTYLHVPAPGLLRAFLDQGARRFVFEGRECGGHVGPRTSFVLWDTMVDVLLEAVAGGVAAESLHVVFAGGIHDARSAAMVAALAAPLAAAGMRLGVLIGTAYLFTTEAVECGAIVEAFQREAIDCRQTVLFETGPGHAIRCIDTAFYDTFRETKRRLIAEGRPAEQVRDALESLNLGRLRIASKGIARHDTPAGARYVKIPAEQQRADGMYMIGQVAALAHRVQRIADLHADVSVGSSDRLAALPAPFAPAAAPEPPRACDVAIVGLGCLLPGARDPRAFWSNVLNGIDAISEVPKDRFDVDRYFDPDMKAPDGLVSRWGGFIGDVPFDPLQYGIPPSSLGSIDPLQLLALEVVRQALADAGYLDREFPRARTSVILGASGGLGELGMRYGLRAALPDYLEKVPEELVGRLPEWTEDSFAGILLNVAAGRIANRFDFGGVNYTVDAACASSLAAVQLACTELDRRTSDMVVVGGVDTGQTPFGYLCFSKAHALSPRGRCRTFDEGADGIAISEGFTALILKRLADAERDGDRIYAVIKAIGGSSDGRGRGLTAPRPEGQVRALERAYGQAGFSPATVELVEAHGTGTVAGDAAEIASLEALFTRAGAPPRSCTIGSVKSMVGHTKAAAGVTGLMKVALALHHRILPPTLHVEQPNPKLTDPSGPFVVSPVARPWIGNGTPRRAGVSSFGFGGTNFHAVVEEYTGEFRDGQRGRREAWPAELFVWRAPDRAQLTTALERAVRAIDAGARPSLASAAAAVCRASERVTDPCAPRVAIVAATFDELRSRLDAALSALREGRVPSRDPRGLYVGEGAVGQVAFLFPGQGSQEPNMLRQLAVEFPQIARSVARADHAIDGQLPERLAALLYPAAAFSDAARAAQMAAVTATNVAQPALGAVEMGAFALLAEFGVRPDLVAGHSYGEYVALCAAGAMDEASLASISELRGRAIAESVRGAGGVMAAVPAQPDRIRPIVEARRGVWLANFNAPQQTVIAGETAAVEDALAALDAAGVRGRRLPVACAFHTPLMAGARDRLAEGLRALRLDRPAVPVYSNALGAVYPTDRAAMLSLLEEHLVSPVRFVEEIEAMYRDGARVFVEVGPRTVLAGLTRQIVDDRALVLALDGGERDGLVQLLHVLGELAAAGVPIATAPLFAGRSLSSVEADTWQPAVPVKSPLWVVNGSHARRANEPPPAHTRLARATASVAPKAAESSPVMSNPINEPAAVPPAALAAESVGGTDAVLLQFQRVMTQFLETQASVMAAFLGAPGAAPHAVAPAPLTIGPSLPLPAPVQPSVATAPTSAASVVQPVPPPSAPPPAPVETPRRDAAALLVRIASDRTGYPADMLDPDLNIEADLGIDSIKRVEILSALQRECSPAEQTRLHAAMDRLTTLKTLREIGREIAAALAVEGFAAAKELPPAAAAAAPAGEPAVAGAPPTDIGAALVALVSERTGYPVDMLDPDLNIEADLGIDSIKRVEILSAFRRQRPDAEQKLLQAAMDTLTTRKTLRELSGAIEAALGLAAAPTSPVPPAASTSASADARDAAPTGTEPARLVLTTVDAPPPRSAAVTEHGRICLITDDGRGTADALASRLARHGEIPIVLRHADARVVVSAVEHAGDWSNPVQVRAMLDDVRRAHGPAHVIVHAAPLGGSRDFAGLDPAAWRAELRRDITALYALVKNAASDLASGGGPAAARVLVATRNGGTLGTAAAAEIAPAQAGAAAWLRTAAIEFPEIGFRLVDLPAAAGPSLAAARLHDELDRADGLLEVGYAGERRVTIASQLAPLDGDGGVAPSLDSSSVVVVTGGARGITALLSRELAALCRPTIVLAGASPLPADAEPAATAALTTESDLKAAVTAARRNENRPVRPVEIDAAVQRLFRDREIRATIDACRRAGARVEYHQVDVRDAARFEAFIDRVYDAHGRIDWFVHGAGVIEDKLIRDKTADSFDRVLVTKAASVHTLARKLRPSSLRVLLLMSSITAVYGNRGQADYGAANGVMNGAAASLAARWPGRVVAMNWGPWDTLGMASAEVRRQFLARGIAPIETAAGVRAMLRELAAGRRHDAVVVVGDGPWCDRALRVAAEVTA